MVEAKSGSSIQSHLIIYQLYIEHIFYIKRFHFCVNPVGYELVSLTVDAECDRSGI